MLQRRLTASLVTALSLVTVASGCGDKPIEDNLVRPGITAIDEARSQTCGVNAATLRTAIDAFTTLNGEPPENEAALVDGGWLRETTSDWDVVDGELVAENPACGPVGGTATSPTVVEIVTESEPLSADQIVAGMSSDQVAEVGGADCARELAEIVSAAERFIADLGRDPADFDDLVAEGYLDQTPQLWARSGDELRPADDNS